MGFSSNKIIIREENALILITNERVWNNKNKRK